MGEELQRIAVRPVGIREAKKISAPARAGIVDQDIEAANTCLDGGGERSGRLLLSQVDSEIFRSAPALFDVRRYPPQRRVIASGQHQVAALLRQRERNAAADAAARSRHQRDLSGQFKVHAIPPPRNGLSFHPRLRSAWQGRKRAPTRWAGSV